MQIRSFTPAWVSPRQIILSLLFIVTVSQSCSLVDSAIIPSPMAISNFLDYFHSTPNSNLSHAEIDVDTSKGGLGLKATSALPAGFRIVSIPFTLLLSIEHVFSDDWAQQHLDPLSDTDAMAIYLAHIRKTGTSKWDPYIQLLPSSFPSFPIFWSESQLNELTGSSVKSFVERRLRRAKETYDTLLDEDVKAELSMNDFLWGLSVLFSRSHSISVRSPSSGRWVKVACQVPMADLFNTATRTKIDEQDGNNVDCQTNDASTHFECFTTRPVTAGEELFVPYGGVGKAGMGNGQLLLDYGFVHEYNPFDLVAVNITPPQSVNMSGSNETDSNSSVVSDSDIFRLQSELLSAELGGQYDPSSRSHSFFLPLPSSNTITLPPSESFDSRLLTAGRIWHIDRSTIESIQSIDEIKRRIQHKESISISHDLTVLRWICGQLQANLRAFPTSLNEDQQILSSLQLDDETIESLDHDHANHVQIQKAALTLRMAEKKIILLYYSILVEYEAELEDKLQRGESPQLQQNKVKPPAHHDEL